MATDPQYTHLQEDLHVYCHYEGDKSHMGPCFARAVKLIRVVLTGGTVVPTAQGGGFQQQAVNNPYGGVVVPGGNMPQQSQPGFTEQALVANAVGSGQIVAVLAGHREMGGHCKTSVKVFVPQRTVMGCSRGKLLGTRGSMLKQLMQEAGCHFAIRGRGSTKDDSDKPSHMQEELHVLVEYEGPLSMRDTTLHNAEMLIRAILTPAGDPQPGQHVVGFLLPACALPPKKRGLESAVRMLVLVRVLHMRTAYAIPRGAENRMCVCVCVCVCVFACVTGEPV